MPDSLLVSREGPVAFVTINRPHVLNAIDGAMLGALRDATAVLADEPAVRVVVVTGAGDKAFAAGADVTELLQKTPAAARDHARLGQQVFDGIERMGKPSIAAINGFALGGGCELAMACTFRVAADTARLGQPEVNLGIIPGFGGTQRLARLVGRAHALDLLLTGRQVGADEALRIGLVHQVTPAASLMAEVRGLAAALASKPALAMRYILEAVHGAAGAAGEALEAALFGASAATADMKEGIGAFLEKRAPQFRGE